MLRVALTGNAAAGKSTVLELFKQWGARVSDADQYAHDAVAPGTQGLAAVIRRFGAGYLQPDGSLDRGRLRRHVMAEPVERAALEAIIHPIVAGMAAAAEAQARRERAPILVYDVPLLFEALDPADYDAVILVDAPDLVRRERLEARGLSRAEAEALMGSQQDAAGKRDRSTYVIENAGGRDALEKRARAVWSELQAKAGSA